MMWSVRLRAWSLVLALLLLAATVLAGILVGIDQRHQLYVNELERQEQHIERLLGLLDAESELRSQAESLAPRFRQLVRDPDHVSEQDFNLLRTVQRILRQEGLSIQRSQEQPRREHEGYATERLNLHVSGTLPQLLNALRALQNHQPSIRIDGLRINPDVVMTDSGPEQRVRVIVDIAVAEWLS